MSTQDVSVVANPPPPGISITPKPLPLNKRVINLLGVVGPGVGLVIAAKRGRPKKLDAVVFVSTYVASCLGVTAGYHRLLTHNSFETSREVRAALAALGASSLQGPPLDWVCTHRKHHNHPDEPGDPHSPHGHGEGLVGALRGLPYAHVLWVFWDHDSPSSVYAKDLMDDPDLIWIGEHYWQVVAASLVLPGLVTAAAKRKWSSFGRGFYWSGLSRAFLLLNFTFSINSLCHFFGKRRFRTNDKSRNLWWLWPFTLGENWHHNHHAFPRSAFHGLQKGEIDPTGSFIELLERRGLVWSVVRISQEKQEAKEVEQIAA